MKVKRLIAVSTLLGLIVAAPLAFAKNPNPGVLSPHSHAFGKTYGEWSAEFWKWEFSLPADHHPLTDTADCSEGQSGKMFFLGGTFTLVPTAPNVVVGIANRTCTVPAGKALFFPLVNSECSTVEGNGTTEEELRTCAVFLTDHTTGLQAEVDGVPIQNLESYRAQSPLFIFGPLPNNNILQALGVDAHAGTTSPSVSDGFYLMLAPLSVGNHLIHFAGGAVFSTAAGDPFDFEFELDVTYNLTVAPRKP